MRASWVLVGFVTGLAGRSGLAQTPRPPIEQMRRLAVQAPRMPRLIDLTVDSARTILQRLKLRSSIQTVQSSRPLGIVLTQFPTERDSIRYDVPVTLTVSSGTPPPPDSAQVPEVRGFSRTAAIIALALAKLSIGRSDSVRDDRSANRVVRQDPPHPTRVPPGSTVNLTFGYTVRVPVPSLRDSTIQGAELVLRVAGLTLGRVDTIARDDGLGRIIRQTPSPGRAAPEKSAVDVTVAVTSQVPVPSVIGLPLARAAAVLQEAGLVPGLVDSVESNQPPDRVTRQIPDSGGMVSPGSRVHLRVAVPPRLVGVPNLNGRTPAVAERLLADSGLVLGRVDTMIHAGTPGLVWWQNLLPTTRVIRGSAVSVRLAATDSTIAVPSVVDSPSIDPQVRVPAADTLPPRVRVPSVTGRTRAEAEGALTSTSLQVGRVTLDSSGRPDTVLSQVPPAGALADSGSAVALVVGASTARLIPVPGVVGLLAPTADSVISRAPLIVVRVDTAAGYGNRGRVVRQDPVADALVPAGTPVRLSIGVWVLPSWFRVALTIAGLGLLAGGIHRFWREHNNRKFRKRSKFELHSDQPGKQEFPDAADLVARPELGMAPRFDPGEQTIEGDGP